MLYSILVAIDVLLAIAIIALVLIQHGKGADAGAAFGSGASGTVFGAQGSASFLTKLTTFLAVLFFANSLWLAHLASNRPVAESVIDTNAVEEVSPDLPGEDDVPSMDSESDSMNSDIPEAADDGSGVSENLQDSMETIKEEVQSTLDDVTPDDVPE
ncbi:MAG: preprotein translocase subunit SecG [Pseudomonadota bacterium]